jgi:hypothetical protein
VWVKCQVGSEDGKRENQEQQGGMNFIYIGVGVVWSFVLLEVPENSRWNKGVSLGTHFGG